MRWLRILVGLGLLAGSGALVLAGNDTAVAETADSSVTVHGRLGVFGDDYRDLAVTVSQTKELTNQAITVSWTGGQPTKENSQAADSIGANFLQIMQCWGNPDDPVNDPLGLKFRETCQWGGGTELTNNRRSLMFNDAKETLPAGAQMVPFLSRENGNRTVNGSAAEPFPKVPCGAGECPGTDLSTLADYFSQFTTNEIYQAATTAGGTGRVVFEVQTSVQSPHLGCGDVGNCSLVIVPRGDRLAPEQPVDQFFFGPLAASVWQDRIVVPLEFVPRSTSCPIGVAERRTVGSEYIAAAMSSWQPAMCADAGKVFGYAPIGDTETSRAVRSMADGAPGLGFTLDPVLPSSGGAAVMHAPVALNSAVIAFNIDVRLSDGPPVPPDAVKLLKGTQVTELKLTPLVVARLLTQYYKRDVPGGNDPVLAPHVKDNPRTLRSDPAFLADNELFQYFPPSPAVDGLMVIADNSAAVREIWSWILADPEAKAFLTGSSVNKFYREFFEGGNVPINFPKVDPTVYTDNPLAGYPYTTTNLRPPVDGLRDGARQALRANARSQVVWDSIAVPPGYKAQPPTEYGKRFSIVITDAASAARYGLPTAKLRNRAGEFVGATADGLLKAVAAMEPHPSQSQVLAINASKATPGVYPLPMLTYAAMDGSEPAAVKHDYAELVRFAAGAGQTTGVQRGQLPPGYVPLPSNLRLLAQAAATQLEQYVYSSPAPVAPTTTRAAAQPPPPAPPAAIVTATAKPATRPVIVAETTRPHPVGNVRYVLAGCLALGALAFLIGPPLRLIAVHERKRRRP